MTTKAQLAPVNSFAREMLKQTLEAQERARVIEENAAAVAQAAMVAVEQARTDASRFADLDEDAVKSRLAVLKGEAGAKTPEEIRELQRQRVIANEELRAAEATLQVAQRELDDRRGNVERNRKLAASHATSILSECATDVIAAWERANEERERLRLVLQGLMPVIGVPLEIMPAEQQANIIRDSVTAAGLPYGDLVDWQHVQKKVGGALARRYAPMDAGPGIARARSYWKQYADAVLADPAAEPAPLPSGVELWG